MQSVLELRELQNGCPRTSITRRSASLSYLTWSGFPNTAIILSIEDVFSQPTRPFHYLGRFSRILYTLELCFRAILILVGESNLGLGVGATSGDRRWDMYFAYAKYQAKS